MNNDETRNAVIDRIKKILAKASNNPSQGEAEVAMAKAHELAVRYSIDLATVDMTDADKGLQMDKEDVISERTPLHHEDRWIAAILMQCYGIQVIWTKSNKHIFKLVFIGDKTDIQLARYVWGWLRVVMRKAYFNFIAENAMPSCASVRNGFNNGFRAGCVAANKRAEDTLTPQERNTYALVLVKKEQLVEAKMKELYPNAKTSRAHLVRGSADAYSSGRAAGSSVKLAHGLAGNNIRPQLGA